jgi:hypothetical protein
MAFSTLPLHIYWFSKWSKRQFRINSFVPIEDEEPLLQNDLISFEETEQP